LPVAKRDGVTVNHMIDAIDRRSSTGFGRNCSKRSEDEGERSSFERVHQSIFIANRSRSYVRREASREAAESREWWLMWQQGPDGRVSHPFEPFILVATLALIPVLIIEHDVSSGPWATVGAIANWVIWAIFAAELVFILAVAPRKAAALPAHWLDVAIVLVTVPFYGELLSSLRSVRLYRLLRLVRAGVVIGRALQAERRLTSGNALRLAALATVFLPVRTNAGLLAARGYPGVQRVPDAIPGSRWGIFAPCALSTGLH
jgi:hypothetical protein